MKEARPQIPSLSTRVLAEIERHSIVVGARYRDVLQAIDDERYLPNSRLMYDVNTAMLSSPEVAARRFARHSRHESSGSRFIEIVANRFADDEELCGRLRRHAQDEARHCLMFAALADRFDDSASSVHAGRTAEHDESAQSFEGDLANFLIATHTAEVRNFALLDQYLRILAGQDFPHSGRIRHVIDSVREDEGRHVSYTAAYVSRELERNPDASAVFAAYTEDYIRDSWAEISLICGDLAGLSEGSDARVD